MAKKHNSNNSSAPKKTASSGGIGIHKLSFYLLVLTAILYLIAMVLSAVGLNARLVGALQGVASALMICIVAVLAWRYVRHKPTVWKSLYVVVLLVVLIGIVIPLCL